MCLVFKCSVFEPPLYKSNTYSKTICFDSIKNWIETKQNGIISNGFNSRIRKKLWFNASNRFATPRLEFTYVIIYFRSTISLYVTHWSSHPYPMGLLPTTEIRICNVVKVMSKKGHSYFTASMFTTFQVLKSEQVNSFGNSANYSSYII